MKHGRLFRILALSCLVTAALLSSAYAADEEQTDTETPVQTVTPSLGDDEETETEEFAILTQPVNCYASVGDLAEFTVYMSGNVTDYQWFTRASSDDEWQALTEDPAYTYHLKFTVTADMFGYMYRCMMTSSDSSILYTNEVYLYETSVEPSPSPSPVPSDDDDVSDPESDSSVESQLSDVLASLETLVSLANGNIYCLMFLCGIAFIAACYIVLSRFFP